MSVAVEKTHATAAGRMPPGAAAVGGSGNLMRWAIRALVLLAVVATGWIVAHAREPAACFRRAIAALHMQDATGVDLERMQYELLRLDHVAEFEAHANLLKAKLLLAEGRHTAALDKLSIADSEQETQPYALVLAGECLYKSGRFAEAGSAWVEALKLDPNNVGACRWLGVAYFELGATEAAIHYLKEVGRLDPNDPRPFRVIGLIWADVDEFESAAEAYRESLRRGPSQPDADEVRFELIQALNELHQDREALKVLEDCPADIDTLAMRAACLYNLGQVDDAAKLLDQAISSDPNHFKALTIRAKIALDRSDPQLAARLSERAERISPKSREALNLLMASYLRLGERDKAKEKEALLQEVNRLYEDYHKLVSGASSEPADAVVRYRAGMMAAKLDLRDAAKWWLRACIYLDPDNVDAARALKDLDAPWHRASQAMGKSALPVP